jgi:hypothetical protein
MIRIAASFISLALLGSLSDELAGQGTARVRAAESTTEPSHRHVRVHRPTKVLVIVEENHSPQQMRRGMPYLFGLARRYAYASEWSAVTHPSLPNYLAITGGSTFGVTDNGLPGRNAKKVGQAVTVFDQALRKGKTAKAYMESMRHNCQAINISTGRWDRYRVKHDFWPYFAAPPAKANCRRHDVAAGGPRGGALMRDVARGRLPNVGMVVPNLDNDAHDGTLRRADRWLKNRLPRILGSRAFSSGRLVVVVTADEGHGKQHSKVLTAVLHRGLSHRVVHTPLTHYSLCRYLAQVVGAKPLRKAARAPDMRQAFGL